MPMQTPFRMDQDLRKTIAAELWRIFGLECEAFTLAFDQGGVSIRIPFSKPIDLCGPQVITGVVRNANEYHEYVVVHAGAPEE